MFEFDNKYLQEEIPTGGTTINKDDCYECVTVSYTHLTLPTKRIV